MAGQERICCLLDVRTLRYEGPRYRGHPDYRHRQPEWLHPYHQKRVPGIQDPNLRGMEGQEGIHGRHGGHLQRTQCEGLKGRPRGFLRKVEGQVFLCHKKLEGQLGRTHRILRVPDRDTKDYLYHQYYREPERKDQEVYQEQAFLPHRRCGDEIRIFGRKGGNQEVVGAH